MNRGNLVIMVSTPLKIVSSSEARISCIHTNSLCHILIYFEHIDTHTENTYMYKRCTTCALWHTLCTIFLSDAIYPSSF
jgi:hypothetical protein